MRRALFSSLFLPTLLVAATPTAALSPSANSSLGADRQAALYREARGYLDARAWELRLDRNHDFALKGVFHDPTGEDHVRLAQTYRGIRVFEGEAILHFRGGIVRETTDALARGPFPNTFPSLEAAEALGVAQAFLNPKGPYASTPTVELVIAAPEGRGRLVLAYHIHTELENGTAETRHTDFLVDAHSGRILESWDTLHTAGATGTGNSQYSGNVSLATNSIPGGFELRDTTRGGTGNRTLNLNHATTGTGSAFTDVDNAWGDGANYVEGSSTTAANGQTAGVDAAYGAQATWDYFLNAFGRNGIDNAGTATYSRVHYSNSYDNAFWSDSCFCMTYGDGNSFTTLTSLDVAGHEMSHGVCSRTANLTYRGESGGLNEANSDIFGSLVEFYARGGSGGNYLIGEQLSSTPLRYMYKPSLDGRSPDFYAKNLKRLDVHYSSGVANHFFFLLAHGSQVDGLSGNIQSPMANGVTAITGLGNDLAGRIWYKALTAYMTSSTNYAGARVATLNAATALGYPAGTSVFDTVKTAWLAVNVK